MTDHSAKMAALHSQRLSCNTPTEWDAICMQALTYADSLALDNARLRTQCSEQVTELTRRLGVAESQLATAKELGSALLELVDEYQAQWGDDYLAKKWDLPVARDTLAAKLRSLGVKVMP